MSVIGIYHDSIGSGVCRSCRAPITWAETLRHKKIPLDGPIRPVGTKRDGDRQVDYIDTTITRTHFETCPSAKRWRRQP